MYSLQLTCPLEGVETLSAGLWEFGTVGIREIEQGASVLLIAAFENNDDHEILLSRFADFAPEWQMEHDTDWVAWTKDAWPGREVGDRTFLAPVWCEDATPSSRVRVIHNPGLACGTGEHPCTQMALEALERCVETRDCVVDVGTGSGILAIAALRLGARLAAGVDIDEAALAAAARNFELNDLCPTLAAASAEALKSGCADIAIANISGTVLLSMMDDLFRICRKDGFLILTGFTALELPVFRQFLREGAVLQVNEWRCLFGHITGSL